jgi:lactoylglutathione lyase
VTQFLHTMIRVTDPDATVAFFNLLGLEETRRFSSEQGRFTLIYLAAPGQDCEVELTWNWPAQDGSAETYTGGRNFGHLAFGVENIYATCQTLADAGVVINRPRATATWLSSRRPTASRSSCCKGCPPRTGRTLGLDAQHRQLVRTRLPCAPGAAQVPGAHGLQSLQQTTATLSGTARARWASARLRASVRRWSSRIGPPMAMSATINVAVSSASQPRPSAKAISGGRA